MNQENSFKQMIQEDNNAINKQLANVKHKLIVLSGKVEPAGKCFEP